MPTFIDINGAQVVTSFTHDARTEIACPACTHLIPNVTPQQLNADPVTGVAEWIDCACQHGAGGSVFAVKHLDCPCYARFRVQYAAGNRYNVVGVDYATMEQRRQEREAAVLAESAFQAMVADEEHFEVVHMTAAEVAEAEHAFQTKLADNLTVRLRDNKVLPPGWSFIPAEIQPPTDTAAAQAELDAITARVQADEQYPMLARMERVPGPTGDLLTYPPLHPAQADEFDEESLLARRDAEEPTPIPSFSLHSVSIVSDPLPGHEMTIIKAPAPPSSKAKRRKA